MDSGKISITEYTYCTQMVSKQCLIRPDLSPLKQLHIYKLLCAVCGKVAIPTKSEIISNKDRGAGGQALGWAPRGAVFDMDHSNPETNKIDGMIWVKVSEIYYCIHYDCLEIYKFAPNMELIKK